MYSRVLIHRPRGRRKREEEEEEEGNPAVLLTDVLAFVRPSGSPAQPSREPISIGDRRDCSY